MEIGQEEIFLFFINIFKSKFFKRLIKFNQFSIQ